MSGSENDPDPKAVIAACYDLVSERYLDWSAPSTVRLRFLNRLLAALSPGARVLDLGCGAGVPVARDLTSMGMRVTGVDLSKRQIETARLNVPAAEFIVADMVSLDFAPSSFDAITAFYSITHVPREEHAVLIRNIAGWLRPGGVFLASLGSQESQDVYVEDWLGAPCYFSHFDTATNKRLIEEAGFSITLAEEVTQDDEPAVFFWVEARK